MPNSDCLKADRPERLDKFLRRNGYQQYRIEILIKCGALKLLRQRYPVKPIDPSIHVEEGDCVLLPSPSSENWPIACQNALQLLSFKDYAFIPTPGEEDSFHGLMRKLLQNRNDTILPSGDSLDSLAAIVRSLLTYPDVTNPIRHMIVSSHANAEGNLQIRLQDGDSKFIDYDDLNALVQNSKETKTNPIRIDIDLLSPRPRGNDQVPYLHFKGCRIGQSPPFLRLWKEALGGEVEVTAPKHFHEVAPFRNGVLEYMGYGFDVFCPFPIKDRAALIRELYTRSQQGQFVQINKDPIPLQVWMDWTPEHIRLPAKPLPRKKKLDPWKRAHTFYVRLQNRSLEPIQIYTYLRYATRYLFNEHEVPADQSLNTEEKRKRYIRNFLERDHRFQVREFPFHQRLGYRTLDEFMEGWEWRLDATGKYFDPIRHEYTLIHPIAGSAKRLFHNFYQGNQTITVMLKEDDPRFFADTYTSPRDARPPVQDFRPPRIEAAKYVDHTALVTELKQIFSENFKNDGPMEQIRDVPVEIPANFQQAYQQISWEDTDVDLDKCKQFNPDYLLKILLQYYKANQQPFPKIYRNFDKNTPLLEADRRYLRAVLRRQFDLFVDENTDGFYSMKEDKIYIRPGLDLIPLVGAIAHELAHAYAHNGWNDFIHIMIFGGMKNANKFNEGLTALLSQEVANKWAHRQKKIPGEPHTGYDKKTLELALDFMGKKKKGGRDQEVDLRLKQAYFGGHIHPREKKNKVLVDDPWKGFMIGDEKKLTPVKKDWPWP